MGRMPESGALVRVAERAARAAGLHALSERHRVAEAVHRFDHDVKLQLDLECQAVAESVIRDAWPGHAILGEEGSTAPEGAEIEWVVDPIDGTVNFSHGLPLWCCSVAATRDGRTVAGAVFAPVSGECFTVTGDGPALCNGETLRVSTLDEPNRCMVATGAVNRAADSSRSMRMLDALTPRVQKLRILGSAALDLCYVAAGRLEGYVEISIFPWDVAAGRLLVERAGGRFEVLRSWGGGRMAVLASNGAAHAFLRQVTAPIVNEGEALGVSDPVACA